MSFYYPPCESIDINSCSRSMSTGGLFFESANSSFSFIFVDYLRDLFFYPKSHMFVISFRVIELDFEFKILFFF